MSKQEYQFKLISSLEKTFFDYPYDIPAHTQGSMLKNEIYSFQLVMGFESDKPDTNIRIETKSSLSEYIKLYMVDYVPSKLPALKVGCDDYITTRPGLFPDVLKAMESDTVYLRTGRIKTIWITIEPKSEVIGRHNIDIMLYDDETLLNQQTFSINIIDESLPTQSLINTCWFHGDCISVLHNVEIGSDKYYEILDKYLAVYTKFGHNMILTPIFTPALDTEVGRERPTNQLIDIEIENGTYKFVFDRLGAWIDRCRAHGIKYFEMTHMFTQWGAEYTPKIMATVDGEYKRIFGWDVKALSDEYRLFLDEFLPQLVRYLKEKGVYENCYFHVSDEPQEEHSAHYERLSAILKKHISYEHMIEAISDYVFYEKGLINIPIPSTDHITPFLEHNVENLWTYYCGAQRSKVSNRFMAMPSYRTRIIGLQMYKYAIKGFLHWGFNFWFSALSKTVIDPYATTDANDAFLSGDAFMVYPLDAQGEVPISLRLYVFNEALQDMRAMELLESMTSRETVTSLLNDIEGFDEYPRTADYILNLRETVNVMIANKKDSH